MADKKSITFVELELPPSDIVDENDPRLLAWCQRCADRLNAAAGLPVQGDHAVEIEGSEEANA